MPAADFDERRERFDLAPPSAVLALLAARPDVVFLDVRSPAEIEAAALPRPHVAIHCTMSDASGLRGEGAAGLLPADRSAPIVAFCGIGGRAAVAARELRAMGYETVLNAGGLKDMDYLE